MRKQTMVNIAYISILITVGLLGISYAGWTDINKLVASITTGRMNYDFEQSGNSLTLINNEHSISLEIPATITVQNGKYLKIDILDASAIMSMTTSDILRINYLLQMGTSGNVSLKGKEEDLGLISIPLYQESVKWHYSVPNFNVSDYSHLVPNTLGTYRGYHRFNGISGEIDLIPVDLPIQPPTTVNYGNSTTQKIIEVDDKNGIKDESAQSQMNEIENGSIDNKDNENKDYENKDNENKIKLLITTETLSLSAEYGFMIPIEFDQFNAE